MDQCHTDPAGIHRLSYSNQYSFIISEIPAIYSENRSKFTEMFLYVLRVDIDAFDYALSDSGEKYAYISKIRTGGASRRKSTIFGAAPHTHRWLHVNVYYIQDGFERVNYTILEYSSFKSQRTAKARRTVEICSSLELCIEATAEILEVLSKLEYD
jgi:hypothetical protein